MSVYNGFAGSNAVRIILITGLDFTADTPSTLEIMYKKPDGTESSWTASILADEETEGKLYYDLTVDDVLTEGTWYVKAKLTYSDGRVLYTEWTKIIIGG